MNRSLTFHTIIYSAGNLLVAVAGIISFPIMTRMLSIEQYGILNLISLTMMFLVSLGKAGLQKSIVRFGSEARFGGSSFSVADVYLTALATMLAAAAVLQLGWSLLSQLLPYAWLKDQRIYVIFLLAGPMVVGQTVYSGLTNVLVSEKQSIQLNVAEIIKRYSGLLFLIAGLYWFEEKLYGYYVMIGLHEVLFCLILFIWLNRHLKVTQGRVKLDLSSQLLRYGIPLIGFELLTNVFSYGDRFLINYYLNSEQLGYYSAAYNLCIYIKMIFVASLTTAVVPMFMDLWEKQGKTATEEFLNVTLRYFMLLAIPAVFGITAVATDLMRFLAGEQYLAAAGVVPLVVIGMFIDGATAMTAAGLQIQKRTSLMMVIMGAAAVFNISINLVLIPWFGISGAALATLLSYLFFTIACWHYGRSVLTLRLDWLRCALYVSASLVMYAALDLVTIAHPGLALLTKVVLGAVIYGAIVLAIDPELRVMAGRLLGPLRTQWQARRGEVR